MESRSITLTLKKAKEWYNSNNEALREAALQAYTENELNTIHFSEIKSFRDACKALETTGVIINDLASLFSFDDQDVVKHLIDVYKLDIIRKALNGDWKPNLVEDKIFYPCIRIFPAEKKTRELAESNGWKIGQTFIANGKKYSLVTGGCNYCDSGMGSFGRKYGYTSPYLGLLSCKGEKIARHMGIYFAKEIFEACYSHHVGTYEWT